MSMVKNGSMPQNGHGENQNFEQNGYDQFAMDQENADNEQMNGMDMNESKYKRHQSILDGLTENRAERCHILLKNLPNEDLVHIENEKIPAFLRIDADIGTKQKMLQEFHSNYMNFNIESMDREVRDRLVQLIDQASEDYRVHKTQVDNLLSQGDKTNNNSLNKQNETVNMRVQQNSNITIVLKESKQKLETFESQNSKKDQMRHELEQKLAKLREIDVNIEQELVKNDNLKQVLQNENELRQNRNQKETELLDTASVAQEESSVQIISYLKTVQNEDDMIKKETTTLKDSMENRKQTVVQNLLQNIEQDKQQNQMEIQQLTEQIRKLNGEYTSYQNNNSKLQGGIATLKDTFEDLVAQEEARENELQKELETLNRKIFEQNDIAQSNGRQLASTQKKLQKLKNEAETLQYKVDIGASISAFHDSNNYQQRIVEITQSIDISRKKGESFEAYIKENSLKWNEMYQAEQKEMMMKIEETNKSRCVVQIEYMVQQIQDKEEEIISIQQEIDEILREQTQNIEDQELTQLKMTVQKKITEHKLLLNDKAALFEEMYSKALLMINRDQQIIQNQGEIVELQHEIDINILEIEQKSAIIHELQEILKEKKELYKKLKQEIKEIEEQCEELQLILKQKQDELETLEDVLRDKEVIIEGLEKTLGEKAPKLTEADRAKKESSAQNNHYKAVQGDIVDELLAKYINQMEVAVPVRRLGDGFYLFGTRKIFAKVLNNKLVVRVGGGFMSFTEFIDTYALVELKKINELQAQGDWDLEKFINGVMEQENSPQKKFGGGNRKSMSPQRIQGRTSPGTGAYGRRSPGQR